MVLRKLAKSVAILAAMLWLVPVAAHHSHGNYNLTKFTHLEGSISELIWMNPHTWLYIDVVGENGEVVTWSLEGASPFQLIRSGWSPDSLKVGDLIQVRCHQLWDGDNGCLLGYVTPPGGEEKEWD